MTHPDRTARALFLLLLAAAVLLLAVSASPGFAAPAASAAASPSAASTPFASAEEEWEEDEEEWEVEEDEEWEVEEGSEEGGGDSGWEAPREGARKAPASCVLYRASAHVVATERGDMVRLALSYTLDKPTKVTVEYWLKGSRGALELKPLRRHMALHGSLRAVEHLSDREMSKVRAARTFVVDLEMAGMPSYCERYCTRHLTARQRRGDRTVWSEPAREAQGY